MLIRVYFFDDRERVINVKNSDPIGKDIVKEIAEKEGLSSKGRKMFALWIIGHDLELRIRPKMKITEAVEKWSRWVEKYTHDTSEVFNYRIVYKREALLDKEIESLIKDPQAVNLLYGEV
jgi:hypothetical protein